MISIPSSPGLVLTPWQAVSSVILCTTVGSLVTILTLRSGLFNSSSSSSSSTNIITTKDKSLYTVENRRITEETPTISSSISTDHPSLVIIPSSVEPSTSSSSPASSSSSSSSSYQEKLNHLQRELQAERNGRTRAERMLRDRTQTTLITQGYPTLPIGYLSSPCRNRRGTPRQGAITPNVRAKIICLSSLPVQCFEGIEEFSHVYVLFLFHENTDLHKLYSNSTPSTVSSSTVSNLDSDNSSTTKTTTTMIDSYAEAENALKNRSYQARVQPPALMGKKTGIFSTRSPHRPNAIGLSLCRLVSVQQEEESLPSSSLSSSSSNKKKKIYTTVLLDGCDLVDGTPIIDIKPYGYFDCPTCVGSLLLKENLYTYDNETDNIIQHKKYCRNCTTENNDNYTKQTTTTTTTTIADSIDNRNGNPPIPGLSTIEDTTFSSASTTVVDKISFFSSSSSPSLPATNLNDAIAIMKNTIDIRTPALYKPFLYAASNSTLSIIPLTFPSLWYHRRVPSWVNNSLRYQEKYRLPVVWSTASVDQLYQNYFSSLNTSKFYSPYLTISRTRKYPNNKNSIRTNTNEDNVSVYQQYEYYALLQALTQILALDIRAVHLGRGKEAIVNKVSVYSGSQQFNEETLNTTISTEQESISASSSDGQEYELYYDIYRLRFYFRNTVDQSESNTSKNGIGSLDTHVRNDTVIDPEQVRNTYVYVHTVELP